MAIIFTWAVRLLTASLLLILGALLIAYMFASRSLPDYDAEFSVDGVFGPVEIVRNNANVPHIFAGNDADVYFGLGFAHAQDRLWQMTMLRRTAQGRLSELFGERTLQIDDYMRRLDLYNLSLQAVEVQDANTMEALSAYAAGVNAWLKTVNEQALGRGAPEFFLFSNALAPWQPADSIAIGKLMALRQTSQLETDVLRARLSLILPGARLSDILPDAPDLTATVTPDFAALFPTLDPTPRYAAFTPRDPLSPFPPRGSAGASNAWAAMPERSAAGGALLATDPHLATEAPSPWYLARLELSTGGVIGATIPGGPTVLIGRNTKIGWGLTASYTDDQDLLIEQLNPENPEEYRTPAGFKKFRTRQSIIGVKDAAPVTTTLRWSDNGPILPPSLFDIGTITPPGHVAALSWTGSVAADTTMTGFVALMRAQTTEAARRAGSYVVAPGLNLVVADRDNIALQLIGRIPNRDPDSQTQGRLPAPGWIDANRWRGLFPFTTNPVFENPEGGILGNMNNKIIDRPFPEHVSYNWGGTQRVQRWQKLMQDRQVHTRESFIEAQLDEVSVAARTLLPLVARDLWFKEAPTEEGTIEDQRKRALALLADWNGEMNEHLPEPLIYAAWMRNLQQVLIRDELGPLADEFTRPDPVFIERVYRDIGGASAWCDIIQSTATEDCTTAAQKALTAALLELDTKYGRNIESWRWGDAHEAIHKHPVLGDMPFISWLVNIRQSTSGGDYTLNRGQTGGDPDAPYQNVNAGLFRAVYDFANPDSSVFIMSTGQSGHFLSRFYDDLGVLWRRGEYIPMSLDQELARAGAVGVTLLIPEEF